MFYICDGNYEHKANKKLWIPLTEINLKASKTNAQIQT